MTQERFSNLTVLNTTTPPCLRFAEHGSSTTWLQTSRCCRAEVEFNSINWVRHGSSTTFETGLKLLRWHWSCRYSPLDQPLRHLRLLTPLEISLFRKTTLVSGQVAGNGSSSWQEPTLSHSWDPFSSPQTHGVLLGTQFWSFWFDSVITHYFIYIIKFQSKFHCTMNLKSTNYKNQNIRFPGEFKIFFRFWLA